MHDASKIGFRRLEMTDLPLMHRWLNDTPAVKAFYADGEATPYEQVVAKYGPRIRGESPTTPYLILFGTSPIGYIQTYLWRDYPREAEHLGLTDEAASLDLFIGDLDFLHRGFGRSILHGFLRQIVFADRRVESCVVVAEVRNTSGLRAYEKAGFTFLRTVESPYEPGPVWILRMGRTCLIPPRTEYLTAPLWREGQRPPEFDTAVLDQVLPEVGSVTGAIERVSLPEQGVCNLLLRLEAEHGVFALKMARGPYRSQELWAEHVAMQALADSSVPVPPSLLYRRRGDLAFQLRRYDSGTPLTALMGTAERAQAITELGRTLAAIHAVSVPPNQLWSEWVTRSLELAARNLAAGVIDPEDFSPDRPPAAALQWLQENRPDSGTVCLLHGDYRPKNLLWRNGQVSAVIDWAFVDVGDPYYDLSIIRWYLQDDAEWQQFLAAYGLQQFDRKRFAFNMQLHTFLNV